MINRRLSPPIVLFALMLGIGGCTPAQQGTALVGLGKSIAGAQKLALVYLGQAPCAAVVSPKCVDPETKKLIKAASAKATTAFDAAIDANAAAGSVQFTVAAAAIAGLSAVIPVQ